MIAGFARCFVLFAVLALTACGSGAGGDSDNSDLLAADHEFDVLQWRHARRESLLAPTGYLNQIGLHWLPQGEVSFGSGAGNDIVLPAAAAERVGVFSNADGVVSLSVSDGVVVTHDGRAVSTLMLRPDTDSSDPPMVLDHESFAWNLIERAGRFAIRFRDYEHPFAREFGELPYFDIDPAARVTATLRRYPEPRVANVSTVIEGLPYNPQSPGVVEFELHGKVHELEAYSVGERLFFVFGDLTNRDETYGAGRFLYADVPAGDGQTVLDFNLSYSPPCAFNDFSTCPVASPRNRLPVRIEAGEKFNDTLHYAGST